jgi:hypothetical protein
VRSLPQNLKGDFLRGYLPQIAMHRGAEVQRDSGNSWQVLDAGGRRLYTVKLNDSLISGTEALLKISAISSESSRDFVLEMRLEQSDWRFISMGAWQPGDWGLNQALRLLTARDRNEDTAASMLRELAHRLISYCYAHPGEGYPVRLELLTKYERENTPYSVVPPPPEPGGVAEDVAVADDDGVVVSRIPPEADAPVISTDEPEAPIDEPESSEEQNAWLTHNPPVNSGYEFHYSMLEPGGGCNQRGAFQITASPLEYGRTGRQSFYIDSTWVLRSTSDNREARADDPAVR